MSTPITISNGRGFLCIISEKLPEDLIPTSIQVLKFCDIYVKTREDPAQKYFDWAGFLKAVNGYNGDELALEKYKTTVINQSEATVATMVEKIVTYLKDTLGISMSESEIAMLKANIERTFTNLKMVKEYGWADFSKSAHGSSSWEYRMLVVFPNPDLQNYFYSAVTTIKLEADIQEESVWWGLASSTSRNFSAHIDTAELVVKKGFRAPTSA